MQAAQAVKSKTTGSATYNPLRSEDIVRIRIPKAAKAANDDDDDPKGSKLVKAAHGIPSYIHFTLNVKGGIVSCHVHGDVSLAMAGTLIDARAVIIEKTAADGRVFIIVDLFPVESTPTPKARLVPSKAESCEDSLWSITLPQAPGSYIHVIKPGGKVPPA